MKVLENLSNDEKSLLWMLSSMGGKTRITIGGAGFRQCLSHRAALAMLSLIGRGLASYELFNDTGRMVYFASEEGKKFAGKISVAWMEQHGDLPISVPVETTERA